MSSAERSKKKSPGRPKKKSAARSSRQTIGRLLLIGGAEDPDEARMVILPHFVRMCGGRRARIVVCGRPSEKPLQKERTYKRLFEKIGAASVYEARITTRHDADDPRLLAALGRATGVFFTGGDQLRLTSIVAGTEFGKAIHERLWHSGLVVAGTSAGAAAAGSTMVIGGNPRGTVRREDVRLAPGLGLWRDALIDTHFAQRGRLSRMLVVFAQNPQIIGVGIDENTAIEVTPGHRFSVVGGGAAFVFDGAVTHSSAPEVEDEDVIAMTDAMIHVLPAGYSFDIAKKRPILPDGSEVPPR